MKFLLDSCISSFAVKDLKDSGFDVLWIPATGKDPTMMPLTLQARY
jgi:hypothetical protein